MRVAVAALLIMSLPAFAGADIQPYGKDTFMIQTKSISPAKARRAALVQANAHCEELGKVMMPQSEDSEHGGPPLRSKDFTMVFSCYAADDPRFEAPAMRRVPDVVIESR